MNENGYNAAHQSMALFDASDYSGRITVRGADALDLLHRLSTNDLRPLFGKIGNGAQTILTTEKARIIDLLMVITTTDGPLLICSKGHEEKIIAWLDKFTIMEDAKFSNATKEISHLLLFGPQALAFISAITGSDFLSLETFDSIETVIEDIPLRVQKSYRIIESGFSIFVASDLRETLLKKLSEKIGEYDGSIIDEEVFEVIRIEAGIPKAPNELNEKHNPLEVSLVQAVSFKKGCYTGQEVIARLDTYDKVQRHLMGVKIEGEVSLSLPIKIQMGDAAEIGEITSFAYSPALSATIGLVFVKTLYANRGSNVSISGSTTLGTLENLPFEIES